MAERNLKPAASSSRSRAIPAGSSPGHRQSESFSGSPSRASATARLATPVQDSPLTGQRIPRTTETEGSQTPLAGASGTSVPGPGASSLSQALRSYEHSPPRFGTPPAGDGGLLGAQRNHRGSFTPSSGGQLGRSPRGGEDIEVLRRHLAGPQTGSQPSSYKQPSGMPSERPQNSPVPDEGGFSSLQLQGGDTTRHIYRYAEKREKERAEEEERETGRLKRSRSMNLPKQDTDDESMHNVKVPGGFRRDHIRRQGASPAPSSSRQRATTYGTTTTSYPQRDGGEPAQKTKPQFLANNFIEFLTLYGHFAGEELDEDDELLGPDEYFTSDSYETPTEGEDDARSEDGGWGEDSALLTPSKKKRRRRHKHREAGTGTPFGAAMLLLKSFVGTGVLFLPRAFLNGGMAFANLILLFIAVLSYYCFLLLVSVRLKVPASFGDMGGVIYGKHFRNLINFSLVISQIGFASAYIVFVSENLQAFILAVSKCATTIPIQWVILMQMIIFLPLSLYRNINNIQKMALIADLFICLGLIYIYFYDVRTMVHQGGVADDIVLFNAKDWTLFIGTAIFTFEGIGLIIPIQSGMKEPKKFPKVLAIVMVIISVIFISAGAFSYAAYGGDTRTVIILNLPQDDKLVNGVQFLYSLAILLSTPLQIYPAIEITSQQLFSKTGKYNPWIKWQKNVFRFFMVVLCAAIAWAGANDLDKFASLVGSFACIPLVYIYPPLMHYRAVSTKAWQKIADVALVIFGFVVMVYTTGLTLFNWVYGDNIKPPGYCDER
ncbi:vacuolar amino acid transporter 3 [Hortaea werneckii]|nr:vacuolar amino acid transporter 3 [Hortaea werneckii]